MANVCVEDNLPYVARLGKGRVGKADLAITRHCTGQVGRSWPYPTGPDALPGFPCSTITIQPALMHAAAFNRQLDPGV